MLATVTIAQGDTRYFRVPLLRGPVRCAVAGWTFWSTAKKTSEDADADALFQKSTDAGTILPLDATAVYGKLTEADTIEAEPGRYLWDVKGKAPNGDPYILQQLILVIKPRITRAA